MFIIMLIIIIILCLCYDYCNSDTFRWMMYSESWYFICWFNLHNCRNLYQTV